VDFMLYTTEEFKLRYDLYLKSTAQYVFLSSSRVYAESKTPITEESPRLLDVCTDEAYIATDEYAIAKARQEDILKKSERRNWTVIRPYVTFSEIRLQLSPLEKEYWLYRALRGRTIVFSKDIAEKVTTITYGYDVARGIAAIIGEKSSYGEFFTIVTNESHKWTEIFDLYLDVIEKETGIKPKVLLTERWIPDIGGGISQVKYDRLYDRTFNNSKIGKYIDTATFEKTIPALEKCLHDFLSNPHFRSIDWVSEAMKDRMTGDWSHFGEIIGVKQKLKYYIVRLGLYSRK